MLRHLPIFALSAAALTAVAGETLVDSCESSAVRVDFSTAAVRQVGALSEILPFAMNSSADWARGGDTNVSATVDIAPMNGASATDPSGWIVAGSSTTIATVSGESTTAAWAPSLKRYYRATLSVAGAVSATAYFDLSGAADASLEDPKQISACTVVLGAGPYVCTGLPVVPTVTVTDGATPLEVGVDFVLSCTDNVRTGTATVQILGAGDYVGAVVRTYAIVPLEPQTVSETAPVSLALDTHASAVRTIPSLSDLFRFAWTSSADWSAGGNLQQTATMSVSAAMASDPTDPTTWEATGTSSNLVSNASGEGVADAWAPSIVGLYVVRLSAGGVETTAFLDMRETEGLSAGEPIEGFTVVLDAASYPCTGYPVVPDIVLSNGTVTLVKDVDYSYAAVGNINAGTARLVIQGIGIYSGQIEVPFTIVPYPAEEVASTNFGTFALDSTTNEVIARAHTPFDFFAAWNDNAAWPAGGVQTASARARISAAPLASPTAEPGDFVVLLDNATGEGVFRTAPPRGYSLYRIEFLVNGVVSETWTRVVYNNGGMLFLVK